MNRFTWSLKGALIVGAVAAITACGGGGGGTPPTPVVALATVTTDAPSSSVVPTSVVSTFRVNVVSWTADFFKVTGTCTTLPNSTLALDSTMKIVTATLTGADCTNGQTATITVDPTKVTYASPVDSAGEVFTSTFTTPTAANPARTVAGTVTGLVGSVVLNNNGGDPVTVSANGPFAFTAPVAFGSAYGVTVATQPATQTCSVASGNGTISAANVTNVAVTCATNSYNVGGTVTGLTGTLVLRNNGGDARTITADGPFTFPTTVAQGGTYAATVATQPVNQVCSITNPTGTVGGAAVGNIAVSCGTAPSTVTASVSDIALSVNAPTTNAALTGNPRQITLTNTGASTAFGVAFSTSTLPTGTTITSNASPNTACGDMAPSATCVLTITPGSTPSSTPYSTTPTPISISVTGTNITTVPLTAQVLAYGSVYQSGYVFAINDAYVDAPITGSVHGRLASLTDRVATPVASVGGVVWSANSTGVYDNGVSIWGIDTLSTTTTPSPNTLTGDAATFYPGQANCTGRTDGNCNTGNIVTYYNTQVTPAVPGNFYAAGACAATAAGYSDWALPAICEMGLAGTSGSGCAATQNMELNLDPLLTSCTAGVGTCLEGEYWSSTESNADPKNRAWRQHFGVSGLSDQFVDLKSATSGARCVRSITP